MEPLPGQLAFAGTGVDDVPAKPKRGGKKFVAAKSLFNSPERVLAGNVGGQEREQTVLTPQWLLDVVGPIALDPCTEPDNPCGSARFLTEADDGLAADWPVLAAGGIVFVNPPYSHLKDWLTKCLLEAAHGARVYLLAPFRPHRRWFAKLTAGYDVVSLAPFAFRGHKQAFPAPLCLVCFNVPVPELSERQTGIWRCSSKLARRSVAAVHRGPSLFDLLESQEGA